MLRTFSGIDVGEDVVVGFFGVTDPTGAGGCKHGEDSAALRFVFAVAADEFFGGFDEGEVAGEGGVEYAVGAEVFEEPEEAFVGLQGGEVVF